MIRGTVLGSISPFLWKLPFWCSDKENGNYYIMENRKTGMEHEMEMWSMKGFVGNMKAMHVIKPLHSSQHSLPHSHRVISQVRRSW